MQKNKPNHRTLHRMNFNHQLLCRNIVYITQYITQNSKKTQITSIFQKDLIFVIFIFLNFLYYVKYNNVQMNYLSNILSLFDSNKMNECRQNKSITTNTSNTDKNAKIVPNLHASNITSDVYASENASSFLKLVIQNNNRAPLAERDQNKPLNRQMTKYDLNCLVGHQSFKQSIIQKISQSSNTQSEQNLQFSVLKSKMITNLSQKSMKTSKNLNREEAQSVIFDSKAEKINSIFEQIMKSYESKSQQQTNIFKQKIKEVNNQIDFGINNLSKRIKQMRVLSLQRKIIAKQNKCKIQIEQNREQLQFQQKEQSKKQEQQIDEQELRRQEADVMEMEPSASKIELMGNFHNQQAAFSQQYTKFVNRLAKQILMDIQFTQLASEYSKSGTLSSIKAFILTRLGDQSNSINQTFFDIDPAQMDPLQKKQTLNAQITETQVELQAGKLYRKYQEIQGHFKSKLRNVFSVSTISLLFDQVSSRASEKRKERVTVGDLLSYLNMRTSNAFRNRYFVKMMKRLNLKPNGSITESALEIFANFVRKT